MRLTRTFAVLEVSQSTYDEIAALLRDAGYDHAFQDIAGSDDKPVVAIDMHGIGLVARPAADDQEAA